MSWLQAWAFLLSSLSLSLWPSGNVVARDAGSGPDALVVSGDSRLLAFVGPSKYVVTVMEACSLDEVPSGFPFFLGQGGEGSTCHRGSARRLHQMRQIKGFGHQHRWRGPFPAQQVLAQGAYNEVCFPFCETETAKSRFLLLQLHSPLER